MFPQHRVITKEIRTDILHRAAGAATHQEVGRVIGDAILEAGVDWKTVSACEVKSMLVEAIRASHAKPTCCPDPLAA